MKKTPKTTYHPFLLVAFYLDFLPDDLKYTIPRSTRFDWKNKNIETTFGYQWCCQQQLLFHTLQQVAVNKKLINISRALIRVIAVQHFIKKYKSQIKSKLFNSAAVVVRNIEKITHVLGSELALKFLQFSCQQYYQLRSKARCAKSALNLCLVKHPAQLLSTEVRAIKTYCEDGRFLHWPLASVYFQMIRDKAARLHQSTFYKYAGLLNLQRIKACHRRKNHQTGIRAERDLQLLHADVTVFKPLDQTKAFIYIVQDNFSRAILDYAISLECRARTMMELIRSVHSRYLQPATLSYCQLMTDDGSENYGSVKDFIGSSENPTIQHIIAQKDIEYSNSMVEAAHKNLKYRFLYHKNIPDYKALCEYLPQAVEDYNNRPHAVLDGLTPLEVLNGATVNTTLLSTEMKAAQQARLTANKAQQCCGYSF